MFRSRTLVSIKSVILFLALVAISLSQDDEDKRNPALEAVGTAAVGAGLLGGLLFGGAVVAKVVGDAAKEGDSSSRSNSGNIGRQHHVAHFSTSSKVCDYQCKSNGGCTATYVGPSRPGKHSGSCFPDEFGGSCSGTPDECQNCNQVLSCSPDEIQKSASDKRHTGGNSFKN